MMGCWNERVMRRVDPDGEVTFAVHEVYYDADGVVNGWTDDACAPLYNESTDDGWSLRQAFERQMRALDLPVLDYETGRAVVPEQNGTET
jgi:hypothetical protein